MTLGEELKTMTIDDLKWSESLYFRYLFLMYKPSDHLNSSNFKSLPFAQSGALGNVLFKVICSSRYA